MQSSIDFVKANMSRRGIIDQAVEECGELIQALSKLRRTECGTENPTPVSHDQALDMVFEELGDLDMCLSLLPEFSGSICADRSPKWKRWADRIRVARKLES